MFTVSFGIWWAERVAEDAIAVPAAEYLRKLRRLICRLCDSIEGSIRLADVVWGWSWARVDVCVRTVVFDELFHRMADRVEDLYVLILAA